MNSANVRLNPDGELERNDDGSTKPGALKLHIHPPEGAPSQILLRGGSIRFGRGEDCNVRVADRKVSRRHAEVVMLDGLWTLLDCASQNGTFLNEVRLAEPRRLRPGDVVKIGDTTIFVALAPASSRSDSGKGEITERREAPRHVDAIPCGSTEEMERTSALLDVTAPGTVRPPRHADGKKHKESTRPRIRS